MKYINPNNYLRKFKIIIRSFSSYLFGKFLFNSKETDLKELKKFDQVGIDFHSAEKS